MKKIMRRILAFICSLAIVFTGISANHRLSNEVQAAPDVTPTGTMSLNVGSGIFEFKTIPHAGSGFLNISYDGAPSDYSYGIEFLDEAFAEKYITFGGGMTYEDLVEGKTIFYVATNSILQLNWGNRENAFTEGWFFTIAKDALIPYATASGVAYMALDKEYVFTFNAGNADWDNFVSIVGYNTTTFSLGSFSMWGNGTGAVTTQLEFTDNNVKDWASTYTEMQNDERYADYIQFTNKEFTELNGDVKVQYVLDGIKCIQIANWGSLRSSMKDGDQMIFYEGLPIYYKDKLGNNWKATLDATYIYECYGSNPANTQIFYGVKLTDAATYGLYTNGSGVATTAQGVEQFTNIGFDAASSAVLRNHNVSIDILNETAAERYLKVADYTAQEARTLGIALRFIPIASTMQIGFSDAAVDALEVGDQILLKKGLPVVYLNNGTLCAATLDADYAITITGNDGTHLTLTYVLSGTYSLTETVTGPAGPEGGHYFWGMPIKPDAFSDIQVRTEDAFTEVWKDYVTLSKHDANAISTDGARMRWYGYGPEIFQGVRLYTNISFLDGEDLIVKKGLPITYTTTNNKTKTILLDKDYGFVYSVATGAFTYDSSIVVEEDKPVTEVTEFGLNTVVGATGTEGTHQVFNNFITDAPFVYENYYSKALHEDEVAVTYLDYSNCVEADTLSKNTKFYFILASDDVQVIQVQFTQEGIAALEVGDKIILRKGMPVAYNATDEDAVATLDDDYVLKVTQKNGDAVTLQAELTGTFSLTDVFYHTDAYMDVYYGSTDDLTDAVPMDSVDLDTAIMKEYLEISGETYDSLIAKGYYMEVFTIPALRGLRINFANFDLKAGDVILFREGLPLTYTTTSGKTKTVYLDGTYGYQKNNQTAFVYDANLKEILPPEQNEFGFGDNHGAFTTAHDDYIGINLPIEGGAIQTSGYFYPDFMSEMTNYPLIQVGDYTVQELLDNDFEVLFIPSAGVVQVVLGNVAWQEGMEITFKKGMTISYYDNGEKQYVLDEDYSYQIVKENEVYILKKANFFVSIIVDGAERVAEKFKMGTKIDLTPYKNELKGKVMSVTVNGEPTADTTLVVSETMEVVIENRSDLCIVVFLDNGKTCAVREYLITDKNLEIPYAPDMDGYDDSWEEFTLVNGTIYVDAIHTEKQIHPTINLSGVVIESAENDAQKNSPVTGDNVNYGGWLLCGTVAAGFAIFALSGKRKKMNER